MNDLYHALRCAFVAGQDGVPWHTALLAIRKGTGLWHSLPESVKTMPIANETKELYDYTKEVARKLNH